MINAAVPYSVSVSIDEPTQVLMTNAGVQGNASVSKDEPGEALDLVKLHHPGEKATPFTGRLEIDAGTSVDPYVICDAVPS